MIRTLIVTTAILGLSGVTALAQEQSEPPRDLQREAASRRAPEKITLQGAVLVSGSTVRSGTGEVVVPASPLVAAAAKARRDRAKVQITDADLSRPGGKIIGVTGGTAGVEVKAPERSSEIIEQHDQAMQQWERDLQNTAQTVGSLQQEVRELRAVAGTAEERVGNEDDPARMEALEASRSEVLNRLQERQEQLEQERQRLEEMKTDPPRIR